MIGTTGRNSRAPPQIRARRGAGERNRGHIRAEGKLRAATMTAPRAAGILRARIISRRGTLAVTNGPQARSNE